MTSEAPIPLATRALICRVGARRIALRLSAVQRVLPMMPLWRPPTMPPVLAGFLPRRGLPLPVLDAQVLLRLPGEGAIGLYSHIILLGGGDPVGLLVEHAEEMQPLDRVELIAADSAETLNGCVEAIFEDETGPVHLIAIDRLIGTAERATLGQLTEAAAAYADSWATSAV